MKSPILAGALAVLLCVVCRSKDCVASRNAYRLTARSCTSNLYPASIKDNRDCLVCTPCRKVCPSDNLRLSLRWPSRIP